MSKRRILEDSSDEDDDAPVTRRGSGDGIVESSNSKRTTADDVLSLSPQEQRRIENCNIKVGQENGRFSSDAMSRAVARLQPFLGSPEEGASSSNANSPLHEYHRYCVSKAKVEEFYQRSLYHTSSSSDDGDSMDCSEETMLLEIEVLRRSSKKVKNNLFIKKGATTIFGPWWNHTLQRVLQLSTDIGNLTEEYTAVRILLSLFGFIRQDLAEVVKPGKLKSLKDKFNVDWLENIASARKVVDFCGSALLEKECAETEAHLDLLKRGIKKHAEESLGNGTTPLSSGFMASGEKRHVGPSSSLAAAQRVAAASNSQSGLSISEKKSQADIAKDVEEESKKKREDAMRARMKAMNNMMRRTASGGSGIEREATRKGFVAAGQKVSSSSSSGPSSSVDPRESHSHASTIDHSDYNRFESGRYDSHGRGGNEEPVNNGRGRPHSEYPKPDNSYGRTHSTHSHAANDGWSRSQTEPQKDDGYGRRHHHSTSSHRESWGRVRDGPPYHDDENRRRESTNAPPVRDDGWGRSRNDQNLPKMSAALDDRWGRPRNDPPKRDGSYGRQPPPSSMSNTDDDGWGRSRSDPPNNNDGYGRNYSRENDSSNGKWGRRRDESPHDRGSGADRSADPSHFTNDVVDDGWGLVRDRNPSLSKPAKSKVSWKCARRILNSNVAARLAPVQSSTCGKSSDRFEPPASNKNKGTQPFDTNQGANSRENPPSAKQYSNSSSSRDQYGRSRSRSYDRARGSDYERSRYSTFSSNGGGDRDPSSYKNEHRESRRSRSPFSRCDDRKGGRSDIPQSRERKGDRNSWSNRGDTFSDRGDGKYDRDYGGRVGGSGYPRNESGRNQSWNDSGGGYGRDRDSDRRYDSQDRSSSLHNQGSKHGREQEYDRSGRYSSSSQDQEDGELPAQKRFRGASEQSNGQGNSRTSAALNTTPGAGRGRGAHVNLPAWMTRREKTPNDGPTGMPSDRSLPDERSGTVSAEGSSSKMTGNSNRSVGMRGRFFPPGNSSGSISDGMGRGRGRGRGKDINKPAWMTKGI